MAVAAGRRSGPAPRSRLRAAAPACPAARATGTVAAPFFGASVINATATDAAGHVYAAGTFAIGFGSLALSTAATGAQRGYVARIPTIVTAPRPARRPAPLQLYPNPASDRRVRLLATGLPGSAAGLRVPNALGQLLRHETLPARRPDCQLERPTLPAGAYTVQLRTASGPHAGPLLLK